MNLVLAGGSSHSDSYVKSLRRHESDRIRFLPWVSGGDLEELLSNAALFVLPSELEGLSLALLDAMAAGVCVLTSDIPENNEVVDGAGFTFHRGDQADLERMLDLLIHNPELRRQSAARERERIQGQYLWPAIARSIETAYYNVLGWSPSEHMPSEQIQIRTSCSPGSAAGSSPGRLTRKLRNTEAISRRRNLHPAQSLANLICWTKGAVVASLFANIFLRELDILRGVGVHQSTVRVEPDHRRITNLSV
jgi:Glycosyl transferases group 1